MKNREIFIGDDRIVLEEVAINGDKRLFRCDSDARIVGANLNKVSKEFPDFELTLAETVGYDFFIEREDGELELYEPDGSVFNG